MKKLLLIGFVVLFLSCKKDALNNSQEDMNMRDSTQLYFHVSEDGAFSLKHRIQAINNSFFFAKEISKDTFLSKILYQKSYLHYSLQEYDSLKIYGNKLIDHGLFINDKRILGKYHYLIGYYFNVVEHVPDSSFFHYNLSKTYYKGLKDNKWVGLNLLGMSLIQQNQNDFFGSKETITEALMYFNLIENNKYISSCYSVIATNHRKLSNYADAIKYYNKAINTTNSKKDKLIYQNNLAATYIDSRQYNNAIYLLKNISIDSLLKNDKKEHARVLDNLAYAQWHSRKNITPKPFLEALEIRQQINDKRGQVASYTHLGEFYSKTYPIKAISYFDSVIQLSKIIKIPRAEKDAIKFLMQLQPQNVNLRDRYVFLQDSLYTQELKVKTQFAKYKYDDKLKQEDILRLEKENVEKELEAIQQRNLKIRSYAVGGLLLLISSFVIYFFVERSKRLKQKNKTAKLEATYETEAELSRKLHDDFGGKLNHAMLLLQSEANNGEVLNIVDGLYNQSRDFSREINDVDTGPNFKDFLLGMMGNYSKKTKLIVSGSTDVDWLKISPISKKTLFKVIQELMINMQKHSDASLVSVAFKQIKKKLKVTYTDDGSGASNEELNLKNGLWNTEKRIKAIGGTIIFDSEKGNGFEVEIEIPN